MTIFKKILEWIRVTANELNTQRNNLLKQLRIFILIRRFRYKYKFLEDSLIFSSVILFFSFLIVLTVYKYYPRFRTGFFEGVYIEFTGMMFDMLVFGILLTIYSRYNARTTKLSDKKK